MAKSKVINLDEYIKGFCVGILIGAAGMLFCFAVVDATKPHWRQAACPHGDLDCTFGTVKFRNEKSCQEFADKANKIQTYVIRFCVNDAQL